MDSKLLTSAESPSLRNGIIVAFFRSVGYGVVYVCGVCVMCVCVVCVCGVFWSHLFSNVLFMSRHVQP